MSKNGASILVVDDEKEIVRALSRSLSAHGYTVFIARSGEEAIEEVARHRPDLMLLDLMLPGISGLDVCRQVRTESSVPILVLSVKETEHDKVEALDLGADDYIQKPFGMNEVLARVRVALRHVAKAQTGTEPRFQAGPLAVDFAARRGPVERRAVPLTPTQYHPANILIRQTGKNMPRPNLLPAALA